MKNNKIFTNEKVVVENVIKIFDYVASVVKAVVDEVKTNVEDEFEIDKVENLTSQSLDILQKSLESPTLKEILEIRHGLLQTQNSKLKPKTPRKT